MTDLRRAALVVAHPGHELRVHRWLELARPLVFVLTDGSGRGGRSRLAATTEILARCGARPAPIYGLLTDGELYRALLARREDLFVSLAEQLATALREEAIELVAGDALEGFNPGHDVSRLLLNGAVARLGADGWPIDNRDFPLDRAPDSLSQEERETAIGIQLDAAALARKLAAARSYPGLEEEVAGALARCGTAAFATEWLRQVDYGLAIDRLETDPLFYEIPRGSTPGRLRDVAGARLRPTERQRGEMRALYPTPDSCRFQP